MRTTHTFAILEISPAAYAEIRGKIERSGYEHAIMHDDGREVIDMVGVALLASASEPAANEHAQPKPPSLVDRLGEQLLKGALSALTDQRDCSAAALLVHAFAELQDSIARASFGRPSGLETGAALRQGDRLV